MNNNIEAINTNKKNGLIILGIILIVVLIIGSTYAYLMWNSNNLVTVNLTIDDFGTMGLTLDGGTVTVNKLAPASCTHSTYATKITTTVSRYNTTEFPGLTTLSLNLTLIYSETYLIPQYMRDDFSHVHYLLSTSPSSCSTAVTGYDDNSVSGTLAGSYTAGNTQTTKLVDWKYLIPAKSGTENNKITETYYLYVWIDPEYEFTYYSLEGGTGYLDPLQNLEFTLTWSASNIEQVESVPIVSYTVNMYDDDGEVVIGSPISSNITQYSSPEQAVSALLTNTGGTMDMPIYLKHTIINNIVRESYLEFIVPQTLATAHPGLTAGTYTLQGVKTEECDAITDNCTIIVDDDYSSPYNDRNIATLVSAFGSFNCWSYEDDPTAHISCNGFAYAFRWGETAAYSSGVECGVFSSGSYCYFND